MKLEIAKIVGASTEKGWAQVHTFLPDDKEKLEKRGQLLAVIALGGLTPGLDVVLAGREVISRIHEEYYGSLVDKPMEQLKKSLEKISREANQEGKLEITAACLINDVLYLAVVGEGKVVLQRQGKVATILSGAEETVETASGYLKDNDVFLLGSKRFFEIVPWGVVQAGLASGRPQEAAEVIAPAVYGRSEEGLLAAVIAKSLPVRAEEEFVARSEKLWKPRQVIRLAKNKLRSLSTLKLKEQKRSGKSLFTIALILFLILGVSVVLGSKQRRTVSSQKKVNALLVQARAKKEEAESLFSLNPVRAKELIAEAQSIIAQAEIEKTSLPEFVRFKEELEAAALSILREYDVEPVTFFDTGLIKEGAVISDFTYTDDKLIILDKTNTAVYSLSLSDKKSVILAGSKDLQEPSLVATYWPKIFVLTKEGIVLVNTQLKKSSLAIKTDEEWGKVVSLGTFAGNLYLLTQKTIWQYPSFAEATEGKPAFGSKRQWLKEGSQIDFSNTQNMTIDGSIWISKSGGEILKFTRGIKDPFKISGLEKPVGEATFVFSREDQEKIYILDNANSRVVALKKNGGYDSEYSWQNIQTLKGLVVVEREGKIFLLAESKVYEVKTR